MRRLMFEDAVDEKTTLSPKASAKFSRIRKRLQEATADIVTSEEVDSALLAKDEDICEEISEDKNKDREFCKMSGDELSSEEDEEDSDIEFSGDECRDSEDEKRLKRSRCDSEYEEEIEEIDSEETEFFKPKRKRRQSKKQKMNVKCALCELATSSLVKAMDTVMEKLAGKAGDRHITDMQLEIFERRVKPLRLEGRQVPNIDRRIIRLHYKNHCVNVIRSVAEDIHAVELAERTLRRSGLCFKDENDEKKLHSQAVNDLHKLSRTKLDLLKFYNSLEKGRKEDELNGKSKS